MSLNDFNNSAEPYYVVIIDNFFNVKLLIAFNACDI